LEKILEEVFLIFMRGAFPPSAIPFHNFVRSAPPPTTTLDSTMITSHSPRNLRSIVSLLSPPRQMPPHINSLISQHSHACPPLFYCPSPPRNTMTLRANETASHELFAFALLFANVSFSYCSIKSRLICSLLQIMKVL
jgi:hypothetical protein